MRSRARHSGHSMTARPPKRVKLLSRGGGVGVEPGPAEEKLRGRGHDADRHDVLVGLPHWADGGAHERPRGPDEVGVEPEADGHRIRGLVGHRETNAEALVGQVEGLLRRVGPGPVAGRVAVLQRQPRVGPVDDGPRRPPAVAVDGVRLGREVPGKPDLAPAEAEPGVADTVGERHQGKARRPARGPRGEGVGGRRSHPLEGPVAAFRGIPGDGPADLGRDREARRAGPELDDLGCVLDHAVDRTPRTRGSGTSRKKLVSLRVEQSLLAGRIRP